MTYLIIREDCLIDYLEFRRYWIEENLDQGECNPLVKASYMQEHEILKKIASMD